MTEAQGQIAHDHQEQEQPMGLLSRFVGIFTNPTAVFRVLKKSPAWLTPLLVMAIAVALLQVITWSSAVGQEAIRLQLSESNQQLTAEQLDQALAIQRFAAPIATLLIVPIMIVVMVVVLGGRIVAMNLPNYNMINTEEGSCWKVSRATQSP